MEDNNENVNRALAFLAGAMVGAGVALLFAPQSGEKTRRLIRTRSRQVQAEVSRWIENVADDVSDKLEEAVDRGREWSAETAGQVRRALDAGREQIRKEVSRIVGA